MFDFFRVSKRSKKRGVVEIYPEFLVKPSKDIMIRGGDFYAIWVEDRGLWSTDIYDAIDLIDREIAKVADEESQKGEDVVHPMYLKISSTKSIDAFKKYCQKQMSDRYHNLDEKLIFANTPVNKKDYASKRLPYALEDGDYSAYEKLISTLYEPEERHKIEWAIGSIVSGDSKKIQKFVALYGEPGSGKGTILDIILDLFGGTDPKKGYCSVFDARALGSANNAFALEDFRSNPLVAVQQDGDLSRVEDNTKLNSLVSHEVMTVNEKFKSTYSTKFNAFLFIGTNKPVKITDSRSGLIRRLIDVAPSGNKIKPKKEYDRIVKQVRFELGAIAKHCLDVYLADKSRYDDYIPLAMLGASNDFYNFMSEYYYIFKEEDEVTLKIAWERYNTYNEASKVLFPYSQRIFKEELKSYFREFKERCRAADGSRVRNYYKGFKTEKFMEEEPMDIPEAAEPEEKTWLEFKEQESLFDEEYSFLPAQYATENDKPIMKWDQVELTLKDLDTHRTHFVLPPGDLVCVDFDIPDENGNKSFEKNFKEASKWPATYAELSKSGAGIHLYYIYTGDISQLQKLYAPFIEIKVFTGKSSLRRRLSKCNDIPIKTISSGLPVEEGGKMVSQETVLNERQLRALIKNCLKKKHHGATAPEVNYIYNELEKKYASGETYDVSNMASSIFAFCIGSTNQSDNCLKLFNKMHFMSKDLEDQLPENSMTGDYEKAPIVIFDCEVFPNLLLVCYKFYGDDKHVSRLINPTPRDIEGLLKFRLVGFNCRKYDNHILYARLLGYSNRRIYDISKRIVSGDKNAFFKEAYNLSYTDVFDFSSKKQSLKKFEIEYAEEFEKRYGRRHQELGLKWDQPVPEEKWQVVAEYCDNDVYATELVFIKREADYTARLALAKLAGLTPNDTTNTLTGRIIFGSEKHPQSQFNYRNLGDSSQIVKRISDNGLDPEFTCFDSEGRPIFPGYEMSFGKSVYRGEEVGEGGYVYAEPGMYENVALLDIASMHPSSIVAEKLFGDKYTAIFNDILQARIAIKHKDYEKARELWDGKLAQFLTDEKEATDLAQALKIAINSVYGLTDASFDTLFRDKRNVDNIVAKRGALFMVNLKHEVQRRGFTVAHIKTDSIKIPNATPEIIQFVMDYGKLYGYNFEHEDTYDRICLVNDAVYIAKYKEPHKNDDGNDIWWTATGKQFQVPFVFKTLFSKEPIKFYDMCETASVTTSIYLDFNENLGEGEHNYIFVGKVGQFCPVKKGTNGGVLLREGTDKDGNVKYSSVSGSKGYRWKESAVLKTLGLEDQIDISYYTKLASKAIETISKYGDYEWFVN